MHDDNKMQVVPTAHFIWYTHQLRIFFSDPENESYRLILFQHMHTLHENDSEIRHHWGGLFLLNQINYVLLKHGTNEKHSTEIIEDEIVKCFSFSFSFILILVENKKL